MIQPLSSSEALLDEWRRAGRPRITADHRSIRVGDWFVALTGVSRDGHDFIEEAIQMGAARIVEEARPRKPSHAASHLSEAAREFFGLALSESLGHPTRSMVMIAVTGTSGKTSTSFLIESILTQKFGVHAVGLIGTIETRWAGKSRPATHTTPSLEVLHRLMGEMHADGVRAVAMEVSSHALAQERTAGIAWDGMVFLNLSPEHLDYHSTLDEYYAAKKLLFTREFSRSTQLGKSPKCAISVSTPWGIRLSDELSVAYPTAMTFGDGALVHALEWSADRWGQRGRLHAPNGTTLSGLEVSSPLLGNFQKENICAAVTISALIGCTREEIQTGIAACRRIPGRLEIAAEKFWPENPIPAQFLVDYAHKPAALEQVLQSARGLAGSGSRVIGIVGCGGDRDPTKRPVMARLIEERADFGILTSDNPRSEDPAAILEQMKSGLQSADSNHIEIIADRRLAIQRSVEIARPGDVVVIAGKGHETYQLTWDEAEKKVVSHPFDDAEMVRAAVATAPN